MAMMWVCPRCGAMNLDRDQPACVWCNSTTRWNGSYDRYVWVPRAGRYPPHGFYITRKHRLCRLRKH